MKTGKKKKECVVPDSYKYESPPAEETRQEERGYIFENGFRTAYTVYPDSKPLYSMKHPGRGFIRDLIGYALTLLKRPQIGEDNLGTMYYKKFDKEYAKTKLVKSIPKIKKKHDNL